MYYQIKMITNKHHYKRLIYAEDTLKEISKYMDEIKTSDTYKAMTKDGHNYVEQRILKISMILDEYKQEIDC